MSRQIESKTIFSADDKVSPVTAKIAKNMIPLANQLSKVGNSLKDFGSNAIFKSGAGLGSVFLGAIKPAMQFEKSMAQVYKSFDPEKLGISKKLFSKQVRDIAPTLGILAQEMATVFQDLPIPQILNLDNLNADQKISAILKIGKTVGKTLLTMKIGAEDASATFNQMYNLLGGKDVNTPLKILDAVNELDNLYKVNPQNMLQFLTKQGGLALGKDAGLTPFETAGIGSAALSAGFAPDQAGTGFKKFLNSALSYTSATPAQQEGFKKIGMTAKKVSEMWQTDKIGTFYKVLENISKLSDLDIISTTKGIFGVEGTVVIKALKDMIPLLKERQELLSDEKNFVGSLDREFLALSKTSSMAVDKMKSSLNNLGIVLGDALLPTVTKIADKISEWTKKYEALSPETKKLIGDTLLITTGLLAFGVAVGGVSYALGGLATAMGVVSRASKLMGGADMLGMIGGFGGKNKAMKNGMIPANSNTLMKKMKMPQVIGNNLGVNMLSDFGGKPANANNKLGFFKKLSNISLTTAGAFSFLGINSKNLFSILGIGARIFSRFILPVGIVVGLAEGISKKWEEIGYMFDKIGNKLNVLADSFGLGGAGGAIKSGASAIADWLGDTIGNTILGLLEMIDRLIYGLSFSANLARTKSWGTAGALTDEMIKHQSMSPKEKEKQQNDLGEIKRAIMSMPFGNSDATKIKEQIVKVDVVIEDHQTRVVRNGITLQTVNTGNSSPVKLKNNPYLGMAGGF